MVEIRCELVVESAPAGSHRWELIRPFGSVSRIDWGVLPSRVEDWNISPAHTFRG